MKLLHTILLLAALAAALPLAAQTRQRYEINVGECTSLKVVDGLNVDHKVSADSAGKVVFSAPRSMASAIIVSNKNGNLKLEIATEAVGTVNLPLITVYSSSLASVENSGDSTVRVLSVIEGPKFGAKVVGNGHLSVRDLRVTDARGTVQMGKGRLMLRGTCSYLHLKMLGTGTIEADELSAAQVSVSVNGTGAVGVWPGETLTVSGTGSTTIYYKGNPEIKKKMLLGPKLSPLPDK